MTTHSPSPFPPQKRSVAITDSLWWLITGVTLVTPNRSARVSTTSLKIPDDVKQLAVAAAQQQGISPHAFMVDAIRLASANAAKRARWLADAVAARDEAMASGKGYAAQEVLEYLHARARGKPAVKPEAKSWRE